MHGTFVIPEATHLLFCGSATKRAGLPGPEDISSYSYYYMGSDGSVSETEDKLGVEIDKIERMNQVRSEVDFIPIEQDEDDLALARGAL